MARPDPCLTALRGGAHCLEREHRAEPWSSSEQRERAYTLAGPSPVQRAAPRAHYPVGHSAAGARGMQEGKKGGPGGRGREGGEAWEQKEVGVWKKLCRREASPRAVRWSKWRAAPFQLAYEAEG